MVVILGLPALCPLYLTHDFMKGCVFHRIPASLALNLGCCSFISKETCLWALVNNTPCDWTCVCARVCTKGREF